MSIKFCTWIMRTKSRILDWITTCSYKTSNLIYFLSFTKLFIGKWIFTFLKKRSPFSGVSGIYGEKKKKGWWGRLSIWTLSVIMGMQSALKSGRGKKAVPVSLRHSFPFFMSFGRSNLKSKESSNCILLSVTSMPFASLLFNQTVSWQCWHSWRDWLKV